MTPILQRLSLTAYRGIVDLVLDGMSPINLIVGSNNAGKSTILEAAGIVLRPPDPWQWLDTVRLRDTDIDVAQGIWSLFPGTQAVLPDDGQHEAAPIVLDAQIQGESRHLVASAWATEVEGVPTGGRDGGRDGYGPSQELLLVGAGIELDVRVEVSVDGAPPIELRFPAPKAVAHQVPMHRVFTVTPAAHGSTEFLVRMLSDVIKMGRKDTALELLKIFDPAVEDINVVATGRSHTVRVRHGHRGVVDLSTFGDGMRRATALALALTRASQGVLLIDEIEVGIHHAVLQKVLGQLLEAAKTSNVQILATTHSLEAIDALLGALEEHGSTESLAAYWVQRKDGRHQARRYGAERLKRMRDGGLDIR